MARLWTPVQKDPLLTISTVQASSRLRTELENKVCLHGYDYTHTHMRAHTHTHTHTHIHTCVLQVYCVLGGMFEMVVSLLVLSVSSAPEVVSPYTCVFVYENHMKVQCCHVFSERKWTV